MGIFLTVVVAMTPLRKRVLKFKSIERGSLAGDLIATELKGSRRLCLLFCLKSEKCLSAAFLMDMCLIQSNDPRYLYQKELHFVENNLVALYGIESELHIQCFVDQSRVTSYAEMQAGCDFGVKLVDSRCTEWSGWAFEESSVYDICGDGSTVVAMNKYILRNCTRPVNGGRPCSGQSVRRSRRRIDLANIQLTRSEALQICSPNGNLVTGPETVGQTWEEIVNKLGSHSDKHFWMEFKVRGDSDTFEDDQGKYRLWGGCRDAVWDGEEPDDVSEQKCLVFTPLGLHSLWCDYRATFACETWVEFEEGSEPCDRHYSQPNAF